MRGVSGMSGLSGRAGRVDILISLSEAIFLLTMLVLRAHRRPMAAGAAGAGKRETDAVHSFAAFQPGCIYSSRICRSFGRAGVIPEKAMNSGLRAAAKTVAGKAPRAIGCVVRRGNAVRRTIFGGNPWGKPCRRHGAALPVT